MTTGLTIRRLVALPLLLAACGEGNDLGVTRLEPPIAARGSQTTDLALVTDPDSGALVISWIEGDGHTWSLYSARSRDGGVAWSPAVLVAGGPDAPGEVHPHAESSPRLVAGPAEQLALVWPNSVPVTGRKWPAAMLRFARSGDGGLSWSPPITLNDDTTASPVSHQFHGATLVRDSGLVVAWLDERESSPVPAAGGEGHAAHGSEPDATIYLTSSADFGRTWSARNQVGWRAACPCCRISLARGPDGEAVAAWRKHYPGDVRDVVTTRVSDRSAEPQRVHEDDWVYPGCPHNGPALATGRDGSRHVVWYNGKPGSAGVYYTRQPAQGSSSSPVALVQGGKVAGAHAAVAALRGGGAITAFDVSAEGGRKIGLAQLRADGSIAGRSEIAASEGGTYPQLVTLGDTAAIVGWTSKAGDKSEVRLARVSLR